MIGDIIAENLSQKTPEQKLHEGLKVIPEAKMLELVQAIHYQYLPKVKAARGESHADTKFFAEIRDAIVWSLMIMEKWHDLNLNYSNQKMLLEFYQNRCRLLEKELDKYNALEDMEIKGALEDYRNIILDKAKSILNGDYKP